MGERILVIEDDATIGQVVCTQLEANGYQVTLCDDGATGLAAARADGPDLVLLDVLLPKLDGWQVCRELQHITRAPIVFITALGSDGDVQRGLDMGADDYIIKPFGNMELLARVRTALHRARRSAARKRTYRFDRLSIDLDARLIKVDGERIFLTPMEYNLLVALAEEGGRVVSHSALLRRVWGPQFEDHRQYLKLYIWYLRQKIEQDPGNPAIILTERGVGYRLASPLTVTDT